MAEVAQPVGRDTLIGSLTNPSELGARPSTTRVSQVAFLVFASGFGVQYAGAAAALLVAWSPRKGFISASLFGVLLAWVYLSYITTWTPIYSEHLEWPASTACVSFIPWAYLVWMMW